MVHITLWVVQEVLHMLLHLHGANKMVQMRRTLHMTLHLDGAKNGAHECKLHMFFLHLLVLGAKC